jgi:hypothetical protein
MANWAGFDSLTRAYTVAPRGTSGTGCNPTNQSLATYTANHYAGHTPTSKYFCRYFQYTASVNWDPAEVAFFRAATFYRLLPISSPLGDREATGGTTGKQYGKDDAATCLNAMLTTLNGGYNVTIGADRVIYVYLDIEHGVAITPWYWEGWAETIYLYQDSTWGSPFYPCVYANPNDTTTMNMLVGYNADNQHKCWGLWSTQPNAAGSNCAWCNNNSGPSWNLSIQQPKGYTGLVLHHWQYALDGTCYTLGSCDACRPTVDNDQSDPTQELTNYMLQIV